MEDFEEKHDRESAKLERLFQQGILNEEEYLRRTRTLEREYIQNYLRSNHD